jgi:hypothetical protein
MILYMGLEEEVSKINHCRWHRLPVFCLTKKFHNSLGVVGVMMNGCLHDI